MTPPCKGCDERHLACHSDCEKYRTWVTELRNAKNELYKGREATELLVSGIQKAKFQYIRKIGK